MVARVVTAQVRPGAMPDIIALYKNRIVPAMKEQVGFLGTTLLTNELENKVMAISFWATAADRLASEASSYLQAQLARVRPFVTAPLANAYFETAVSL